MDGVCVQGVMLSRLSVLWQFSYRETYLTMSIRSYPSNTWSLFFVVYGCEFLFVIVRFCWTREMVPQGVKLEVREVVSAEIFWMLFDFAFYKCDQPRRVHLRYFACVMFNSAVDGAGCKVLLSSTVVSFRNWRCSLQFSRRWDIFCASSFINW
jgi:hypothetical protein